MNQNDTLPITGHLKEVRSRLIWCCLVYGVCFALSWPFYEWFWNIILEPLRYVLPKGHRLIFTGLSEAFITQFKVVGLVSLALSWPIWIWHIWAFLKPGLLGGERTLLSVGLFGSTVLFLSGVVLAHVWVCPAAYQFFISFEMPHATVPLHLDMRISEYISFTLRVMVAFGVCAQLPLIMLLTIYTGFISLKRWVLWARPVCAAIFVVAAFITPPDIWSMLVLALTLCALYAATLALAYVMRMVAKKENI